MRPLHGLIPGFLPYVQEFKVEALRCTGKLDLFKATLKEREREQKNKFEKEQKPTPPKDLLSMVWAILLYYQESLGAILGLGLN